MGYRLARGMFWGLAGAVISRSLGLVSSMLVARMLGKAGFGELGIIQSTIGMFAAFAGLGLGLTATKYVSELREKDPGKAGRIIALSTFIAFITGSVMTLGLLAMAPWLTKHTLEAPHLSGLLKISALTLLLGAVNSTQTGVLAGFEAFRTIAKVNLWSGIAAFPLVVAGAKIAGLTGAVWALVASSSINCILNHFALRNEILQSGVSVSLSGFRKELPILWNYSFPALLSGIAVAPVTWACNAILVNQPNGYAEMGIFNAANQWFYLVMFLPTVLGQTMLPALSQRLGYNDTRRSKIILISSIKLNMVVVFPIVIVGCLISPIIMSAYGAGFRNAWPTLVVVLLTAGLLAVQLPTGTILEASGKMWLAMFMNSGWGVIFLVMTFILARYGATGLALSRAFAYALHFAWSFAFAFYLFRSTATRSLDTNP